MISVNGSILGAIAAWIILLVIAQKYVKDNTIRGVITGYVIVSFVSYIVTQAFAWLPF